MRVAAQTRSAAVGPAGHLDRDDRAPARVPDPRHRRVPGQPRRRARAALALARSTRRCSVRSPRSASHTSIGPAIAPCSVRWRDEPLASARPASVAGVTTAPSRTSLWPDEVLRHRVHDDVGAQLERALEQRCGEGVVDDGEHPALAGGREEGGEVGDLEEGVRRRLQPEQVGAVEGREHGIGVGDVDPPHDGGALGLARRRGSRRRRCRRRRARRRCRRGARSDSAAETAAMPEASTSASPPSRSPSGRLERAPRRVARAGVHDVAARVVRRGEHEGGADLAAPGAGGLATEGDDAGGGGETVRPGAGGVGVTPVRLAVRGGGPGRHRVLVLR